VAETWQNLAASGLRLDGVRAPDGWAQALICLEKPFSHFGHLSRFHLFHLFPRFPAPFAQLMLAAVLRKPHELVGTVKANRLVLFSELPAYKVCCKMRRESWTSFSGIS
jgi:hypothetical protein